MKCAACGYDPATYTQDDMPEFIEMRGVEIGPFRKIVESIWPDGTVGPHVRNSHLAGYIRYEGTPISLYACPQCKTVRLGD